jgi:hypothetical protein
MKALNGADDRMKYPIVPENDMHRLLEVDRKKYAGREFFKSSVSLHLMCLF